MPDQFNDEHSSSGTNTSENDGRRQHKYSTKDMKPERPWKRWCLTALCCLICIAIMILLTLWLQRMFDPDEDEDWTPDDVANATGALAGTSSLLPQTMDYVEDVCSETRLGQDDRTTCEAACKPAQDCCDPFGNGNSTCFETEGAGCFTYAKCHSLNGFLDPAHNDLDRVCSKAEIEINREECVNACASVACCFMEEESCVASNFQACMDYAACQNLKEDSIDVAPMDLDEHCGKQTQTCERDCREALACSDPNSAAYRDNFITCLSYSACTGNSDTKITVAPMYSRVDPAPTVLDDVCSTKGLAEFGPDKCLEACAIAQCCWDNGAGGCFGDDPLGCMEYQRCTILNQPEYDSLTYPPVASRPPKEPEPTPGAGAAAAGATAAPEETPVPEETNSTLAPSVTPAGNNETAGAEGR